LPIDPTVSPTANKKPVALDDLMSTQQGKSVLASAAPNDSDPDLGQTLTFASISNAANGTVTMFPNGTYAYVPNPSFTGTDSFKYKICDSGTPTLCDSATVIITISPSTTKPDAVNDINSTPVGKPATGNLLANDNGKGLPLSVEEITPPKHGTIVIDPQTGLYTYEPTINYVGKDSVQYKICNDKLPAECDSAWLFINVTPTTFIGYNNKPIASNDVNATDLNTPVLGNVSGNDKDPDAGQILTFTSLGNPPNGTVVLNPDGSYTYTPTTGFFGKDTFKYKVCDNGTPVLCDTASVTITVSPSITPIGDNRPPVANDDVVLGEDGKPLTTNIATNDTDPDVGQTLTFTAIGGNPNVTISPTGVLTYTPTLDPITSLPVGGSTVTYTVCDDGNPSKCDTATVYLNITPSTTKPLAINDIITTPINTSVSGDLLTNDDKKGLPVTITALTAVNHGIFTLNPNGTYTYLPNTNFVGKDSIQYQICNNLVPAECSKAWLYITVQALPTTLNDKPVASPDIAQTLVNVPVTGKVTNNDTDPEGQPLVASLLSNPTNGTLVFNPDGTFTYTPNPGFVGKDTFKYKVCDNGTPSLCDTASVSINVNPKNTPTGANDAPFANDDAFSTTKNTAITASASPNDFEPNAGQTLAFTPISTPANGTVVMNPDGTFTYTPFTNYVGTDKFKYKVCDSGTPSLCDTATVYVTILPPPVATITAPLAINDINITPINTLVTGNILTNDDKKGLPVTIAIVAPATNGTFTLGLNGAYTYLPNNNYVGKDSVRYEICNNLTPSECDQAWVYITINDAPNATPTNPPIAMPDVNQTLVNKSVSGTVANNDSDPDAGQILSYTKLTNPTNGTVIINAVTGAYTYIPNATFVGTDIFTYKVCDNGSPVQCASTNVTIKVTPDYSAGGNIKPIANDDAYSTGKGVGINGNASSNDYDPNVGQLLSYAAISVPANGTVTMNPDGSFSYAPSATFVGTDKFLYKICDNGSPVLCDTATIYISVTTPKVVSCITFNLKAILEGPYSTVTGKMSNFLNFSGLLPGQTPTRFTGVATPDGQPYKTAPWNYNGTEVMPAGGYPADVVDWVLVSLRTDSLTTTPTFRAAGLLHDDGTITFVNPCFTVANGSYYILVEHRNHMGAMSHQKINITSGTITYDFTARDSYALTNPPSYGQKARGTVFVMYAADHKKALQNDNFDINAADSNLWKGMSGIFDRYLSGDYNFDADVNNADNTLWKVNNGRFSGVLH
jgi:large repetitive protein